MAAGEVPPPPEKPTPDECCGSGCVPCIFDYYYDQLEEWKAQYGTEQAPLKPKDKLD